MLWRKIYCFYRFLMLKPLLLNFSLIFKVFKEIWDTCILYCMHSMYVNANFQTIFWLKKKGICSSLRNVNVSRMYWKSSWTEIACWYFLKVQLPLSLKCKNALYNLENETTTKHKSSHPCHMHAFIVLNYDVKKFYFTYCHIWINI